MAAAATASDRTLRLHPGETADQRGAGARDRDRILYSSAFRRLAGVTQVVGSYEGHVFHNRLTHTLEVAQIARRLAEKLRDEQPAEADALGGLDPEVVDAAALAHDLGHPPFGHIGESELNAAATDAGVADGFEGNAQSFRIVTRLAAHRREHPGLNLTRATLNAILKYPWHRGTEGKRARKFGAYRSEAAELDFARAGADDGRPSLEAAIMDHADAAAYSVHDFEDFYRAGLIPVERLHANAHEFHRILHDWKRDEPARVEHIEARWKSLHLLLDSFHLLDDGYRGTVEQRAGLKSASSRLIRDFIFAVRIGTGSARPLHVEPDVQLQMDFLQRLVRLFVIQNPRLATQQHGQRRVLRTLFDIYHEGVRRRDMHLVPPRFLHLLKDLPTGPSGDGVRLTVDIVAGFTDQQAVTMYRRLTGSDPGSVMDVLHG